MTGMLGHPVAASPIDRMFDAVYAHYGLHWQFWKNDIASEAELYLAVKALSPLGYRGMAITVPYKVAVIPLLDAVDDDVRAIGAANYLTIEKGRLTGHNNDGKGVVKAIEKVAPLTGQRVVMLGAGGAGREGEVGWGDMVLADCSVWRGAARRKQLELQIRTSHSFPKGLTANPPVAGPPGPPRLHVLPGRTAGRTLWRHAPRRALQAGRARKSTL